MTKSRGAYLENILEKNAASWYLYVNNGAAPISEILGAVRNEINNLYFSYWILHLYFQSEKNI